MIPVAYAIKHVGFEDEPDATADNYDCWLTYENTFSGTAGRIQTDRKAAMFIMQQASYDFPGYVLDIVPLTPVQQGYQQFGEVFVPEQVT